MAPPPGQFGITGTKVIVTNQLENEANKKRDLKSDEKGTDCPV